MEPSDMRNKIITQHGPILKNRHATLDCFKIDRKPFNIATEDRGHFLKSTGDIRAPRQGPLSVVRYFI